ncbi:MAG TPA: hypothetical protein VMF65_03250 [Acidimicrobiales bacterium]|nr:hypothetical protein [Acidimicrobiales bacterium]
MDSNTKKMALAVLAAVEVVVAALAWRDLARRPDAQVRGNKNLWRLFIGMNPGNSLFYWVLGRRR